jgi:hypothetical protein
MSTESDPPAREPSSGADEPLVAPRQGAPAPGTEVGSASGSVPATEAEGVSAETPSGAERSSRRHPQSPNMLPAREKRRSILERLVVRLIATCGIVGIGVAIAAIMVSSKSQGWVVGLVVSIVSVVLAALLWSSRSL